MRRFNSKALRTHHDVIVKWCMFGGKDKEFPLAPTKEEVLLESNQLPGPFSLLAILCYKNAYGVPMTPPVNCRPVCKTSYTEKKKDYERVCDILCTDSLHFNDYPITMIPYTLDVNKNNDCKEALMQSFSLVNFDFSAVSLVSDNSTVNGLVLKNNDLFPVKVDQENFQKLLYVYNVKFFYKNNNKYFDFMAVFLHLKSIKKSNILELKKLVDEVLGWKFFEIDNSKTVEQEFDRLCMFARYSLPVHFGVVDGGH